MCENKDHLASLGIGSRGELVVPPQNQGQFFEEKFDEAVIEVQESSGRGLFAIKDKDSGVASIRSKPIT